jgi:hypothetical protein
MSEPGGTFKVYEKQWIIVFASDPRHSGYSGQLQCSDTLTTSYAGKVIPDDAKVEPAVSERDGDRLPWYLKLRLWALVAEYREEPGQWKLSGPADVQVVRAGSPEERKLLDYGRKKLAA